MTVVANRRRAPAHALVLAFGLWALCSSNAAYGAGPQAGAAAPDPKTASVVSAARAALGGARLAAVRSLQLEGQCQIFAEYTLTGTRDLRAVLPDAFLFITRSRDVNSTVGWGLRKEAMFRVQSSPSASLLPKAQAEAVERVFEKTFRREATRLLVGLLLTTETPVAVSFAYGGQAHSPDGVADVIDLKWSEGLDARLFVDADTHLPLMMTFEELRIRGGPPRSRSEMVIAMPEWEKVAQALYFSDHRKVDGVMIPHAIIHAIAGNTYYEWTVDRARINPPGLLETFLAGPK